ncbi:MAG TPA: hypothetical protein VFU71_17985 [Burkholderiaceae bacterium]|nr:hypothetical protein [Burkholderiaceae bacterium]
MSNRDPTNVEICVGFVGPRNVAPGAQNAKPRRDRSQATGVAHETLDERAKKVARHVAGRKTIARDVVKAFIDGRTSRGPRAADAVASFGGSWTFVGIFGATLLVWVG